MWLGRVPSSTDEGDECVSIRTDSLGGHVLEDALGLFPPGHITAEELNLLEHVVIQVHRI